MIDPTTRQRTFLFLQGLASDFFNRLGATLAARGHRVVRINLNAGDAVSWRNPGAYNYRGRPSRWPAFVADFMQRHAVTDLVLFGDCRPMHRAAIGVAADHRVSVHVAEEGYLRPDWVTVELGGVNGHSTLPRDPQWYRDQAAHLPPAEPIPAIASSFRRRALEDLRYNLAGIALAPLYPHYRSHRPWPVLVEYAGWAWRLLGRRKARARASVALRRLADGSRFFLFPLQLDCDSQIRLHSNFTGMRPAIEHVLASFAAHAPEDALLVVKEHPLDNGLVNWARFTAAVAERLGLGDRLVFLEDGDIAQLVGAAAGVVTVNSTTGTLSLASGIPTVVLGNAIYDLQGLTFGGELAEFWTDPTPPDASLFDAFRRVLVRRCLIRGGFFSEQGLDMLVEGTVARLEAVTPSPVMPHTSRAEAPAPAAAYGIRPAAALRQ